MLDFGTDEKDVRPGSINVGAGVESDADGGICD
jgi:hypothetical protein